MTDDELDQQRIFKSRASAMQEISYLIKCSPYSEFPVDIFFQKDITERKFKITISIVKDDFFYDSEGTRWERSKTQDE